MAFSVKLVFSAAVLWAMVVENQGTSQPGPALVEGGSERIGMCPPREPLPEGGVRSCPYVGISDDCSRDQDCPRLSDYSLPLICCPTDSIPGCFVGHRCVNPVFV